MATVQAYTKAGVDAKFNSRSNMTIVHSGGGTPDISAFPDVKTGDVIERSGDGARWIVLARNLNPVEGRVVSVSGKTGAVTLTPSDVGAAPASHTHTKAQISDLNASSSATANSIVQRDTGGRITTATPTANTHAVTKEYVDSRVGTGVTWGNISDKPATFPPATHTHTISDITDLDISNGASANTIVRRTAEGQVVTGVPTAGEHATTKQYVDSMFSSGGVTWGNLADKPTTFPPDEHTHHVSAIQGLTLGLPAAADTVPIRSATGTVATGIPTWPDHATPKSYVDSAITDAKKWSNITGKPTSFTPSAHTHTFSEIRDVTLSVVASNNSVVQRDPEGRIAAMPPTLPQHVARKDYVDSSISSSLTSAKFASSAITDTVSYLDGSTANGNRVVASDANGRISAGDPATAMQVANKRYVDSAVTAGATWSSITGKPATYAPSAHTHTVDQITGLNISESNTAGTVVKRDTSGRINIGTPSSTGHATTKAYVDNAIVDAKSWSNLTGVPSTFTPSAHTHTVAQITDLTLNTNAVPNTVPVRNASGTISVAAPQYRDNAATKGYADDKFESTVLTTEDLNNVVVPGNYAQRIANNAATARNYPESNAAGHLVVARNDDLVLQEYTKYDSNTKYYRTLYGEAWFPWKALANAKDVQSRPAVFSGPSTPPASIPGAVKGDHWIDERNGNWYKITGV